MCHCKILSSNIKSLTFLLMFWIKSWWKNHFHLALNQMKLLSTVKINDLLYKFPFCEPLLEIPRTVNIVSLPRNTLTEIIFWYFMQNRVPAMLENTSSLLLWCREKQPITMECIAVQIGFRWYQRLGQYHWKKSFLLLWSPSSEPDPWTTTF